MSKYGGMDVVSYDGHRDHVDDAEDVGYYRVSCEESGTQVVPEEQIDQALALGLFTVEER